MRCEFYWNFHRKCYSIRALEGPSKGRVIDYTNEAYVEDATFSVGQRGRERVLREKKKNVHAFVRGRWVAVEGNPIPAGAGVGVGYNPYQWSSFMAFPTSYRAPSGSLCFPDPYPITKAKLVRLSISGPEPRSNMRALP